MIIPGFEAYDISADGVVTRIATGKRLRESLLSVNNGKFTYKVVYLHNKQGKTITRPVLRLLALAYLGVPKVSSVAKPIDGNHMHTSADNVMWLPYSKHVKESWDAGKMEHRRKRQGCSTPESIRMLLNTMEAYDEPVTMTELSEELQVPYCIIRYSMLELRKRGQVRKTQGGFEVIR